MQAISEIYYRNHWIKRYGLAFGEYIHYVTCGIRFITLNDAKAYIDSIS